MNSILKMLACFGVGALSLSALLVLSENKLQANDGIQPVVGENQLKARKLYDSGISKGKESLYSEAIADFSKAIELDPNSASYHIARGHARYLLGDRTGAIEDFQRAEEIYKSLGDLRSAEIMSGVVEDYEGN